jgi:hypothetical protein
VAGAADRILDLRIEADLPGAAVTTTFALFSSLLALADGDKAALVAARSMRETQLAKTTAAAQR